MTEENWKLVSLSKKIRNYADILGKNQRDEEKFNSLL